MVNNSDKDQLQRGVRNYEKWKCCLTAIVIAAGSMLVGCQGSSSAKPIEAMYIPAGEDGHLMVGEETGNVFTVTMPDNIQDKNGKKSPRKT